MDIQLEHGDAHAEPAGPLPAASRSRAGFQAWIRWTRLVRAVRSRLSPTFMGLLAVTAALYLMIGHMDAHLGPDGKIHPQAPRAESGDEPHYLLMVNSLLLDHDLRLDPDFVRIRAGGLEAGATFSGQEFGGHALLVNRVTGASAKCFEGCSAADAETLGGDLSQLALYPAHPVGFPLFMALLAWPFRPEADDVEALVGTLAICVSIVGVLATYAAGRRSGFSPRVALASAALLGFASSWLPYARSYFAESASGLFLILGYLALRCSRPGLSGLAIGVAMSMKSVFIFCGFMWIIERLWERRFREASFLTAGIGACGLLQVAFYMQLIHRPLAIGSGTWVTADGADALLSTLFDAKHGLVTFMPWALLAFIWPPVSARMALAAAPHVMDVSARLQLALASFSLLAFYSVIGWGPGFCYGPRYWVALLPYLALLTVDFAVAGKPWRGYLVGILAAVAMLVAVPGAIKYRELFGRPAAAALFIDSPH